MVVYGSIQLHSIDSAFSSRILGNYLLIAYFNCFYSFKKLLEQIKMASFIGLKFIFIQLIVIVAAEEVHYKYFSTENESNIETLQLVQVLFRHGARSPVKSYPTNPMKNIYEVWTDGLGQLTNAGIMQHYELGKYLRQRYDHFLSPKYVAGEVVVTSSDLDRTIMSTEANLAGLFKPINASSNWNQEFLWTPVPFRTLDKLDDNMLQFKKPCPKFDLVQSKFRNGTTYQTFLQTHKPLFDHIVTNSGIESEDVDDIIDVFDNLYVQKINNIEIPEWGEEVLKPMIPVTAEHFTFTTATKELQRFRAGVLLGTFLENMEMKRKHKGDKEKLHMFSGHDKTITVLLHTLGVFNYKIPPYASAAIVELHKNHSENAYFVEVFYRNDSSRDLYRLEMPECKSPCNLNTLLEVFSPIIPENWNEECELEGLSLLKREFNEDDYTSGSDKSWNLIALGALGLISLACFILGSILFFRIRKNATEDDLSKLSKNINNSYSSI